MNSKIRDLFRIAGGRIVVENGNTWTYTDDGFDPALFADLVVLECYHVVVSNPHIGTSLAGANMKKHFELDNIGNIAAAERLHSDKGYSIGTPEAQEAFDSKRAHKL
jgi:hypothetical protein